MKDATCPLCLSPGGAIVFQGKKFRVIRAQEVDFPAFYRVVWTAHVAEFSDLSSPDRALCMAAVCEVEQALRAHLQPTKINLAALGNVVAHLHWHVIARFDWDTHFPAPVWAAALRPCDQARTQQLRARRALLEQDLTQRLAALV